LYRLKRLLSN